MVRTNSVLTSPTQHASTYGCIIQSTVVLDLNCKDAVGPSDILSNTKQQRSIDIFMGRVSAMMYLGTVPRRTRSTDIDSIQTDLAGPLRLQLRGYDM